MQNYALLILMFGLVGVMMVFSSRNKKKMAVKAQELQSAIVPGTRVMTTSGMHATVTAVADDTIELEIAPGVYTTWIRAAVREVVVALPEDAEYENSELDDTAPSDTAYGSTAYGSQSYGSTSYDPAHDSGYGASPYRASSAQDAEPIHDNNLSLEKRNNDIG